jgi:7-cyano-7-deazaguanine synthase in queuosine biosynthesis
MKIAFHSNQLSLRGTEVALYDYAHYNEKILGNKSIIITKHPDIWDYSHPKAIKKFQNRFQVFFYKHFDEVESILDENNIDVFYAQKAGMIDGIISKNKKTVIHTVFQYNQPHGDIYAYISKWLADKYNGIFVPYIVNLPKNENNLRKKLSIPENAIVFGRHGGIETFDIIYAQNVVKNVAKTNKNIYFLFLNTNKFSDNSYKNIIYLDGTDDLEYKTEFINTCDAMIHARKKGESFGLAIAEFSIKNKPIITCKTGIDLAHLELLNGKGYFYDNEIELFNILINFKINNNIDWNCYKDFTPEKVMEKFEKVFLK